MTKRNTLLKRRRGRIKRRGGPKMAGGGRKESSFNAGGSNYFLVEAREKYRPSQPHIEKGK